MDLCSNSGKVGCCFCRCFSISLIVFPDLTCRNAGFGDYIWLLFCFLFSGFIFSLACNAFLFWVDIDSLLAEPFEVLPIFFYRTLFIAWFISICISMSTEFLKFILRSNLTGNSALSCLFYFLLAQQQTGNFLLSVVEAPGSAAATNSANLIFLLLLLSLPEKAVHQTASLLLEILFSFFP